MKEDLKLLTIIWLATIISGYLGIVLTAMKTDYYPRIYGVILYRRYEISLSRNNFVLIFVLVITIAIILISRTLSNEVLSLTIGFTIFIVSAMYSFFYLKNKIGMGLVKIAGNYAIICINKYTSKNSGFQL